MKKISFALIFLIALAACQKASTQSAEPAQKIRVSSTTQPQSTLIHVAVTKGYFVEECLEVESLIASYGKASLPTFIDNKSDFAAVAETPFMFNVLKGEKIFVIANI
jgi:ABC-type nitrate/sulfonate/bicarbonate transport system substrate-binding protein